MMARGDQLAVELLIAAARTVAPHVDLTGGFAVIPLTAIASSAADPRLPLFVTRTASQKETREGAGVELPGRSGSGAALLERLYGAQHRVTILPSGETTTLQSVTADQSNAWDALLIPPLAPIEALASPWAMPWLSARLRAPDGCPWDREQTHLTLAKHLIEEAWELHDAIEAQAVAPSAEIGRAHV